MFVDPDIAQAMVKRLNRWYRKRAKPCGKIDHYYRGIRMVPTAVHRAAFLCLWLLLLFIVVSFFFVPDIFSDKSYFMKLILMAGWLLMAVCVLLGPLAAARDFAIITEDGLIKPGLFRGETRVAWNDITSVQIKPDDNDVVFAIDGKKKCKISLAYDGWRDLLETASRHLNSSVYYQLQILLQNVDLKHAPQPNKKARATTSTLR